MPLIRETPRVEFSLDKVVFTCSTGDIQYSSDNFGVIHDRLDFGRRYYGVAPILSLETSAGSTLLDKKATIAAWVQHGDSSGGGDMANLSSGSFDTGGNFYSSALTTDMKQWSTGRMALGYCPGVQNIVPAKRFLRLGINVTNDLGLLTTVASETMRVVGKMAFLAVDEVPRTIPAALNLIGSTSTST